MKHANDTIIIAAGRNFLLIEQGLFLLRENENRDPAEAFIKKRYRLSGSTSG